MKNYFQVFKFVWTLLEWDFLYYCVLIVFSFSTLTRFLTKRMTHTSGGSVTSFVLLDVLLVVQVQRFYLKYIFLFTISTFIFEPRKKM